MTHTAHPAVSEGHAAAPTHAEEAARDRPQAITFTVRILGIVEEVILALIAIVLIFLAVLLLLDAATQLVQVITTSGLTGLNQSGDPTKPSALTILESVLLVAVIMEIVYTVTLSLRSHELSAEPFLVIGIIAAIRRILEITIKSSGLESTEPGAFQSLLTELGLLSVIVIALAVAMFLVRRSRKFLPDPSHT